MAKARILPRPIKKASAKMSRFRIGDPVEVIGNMGGYNQMHMKYTVSGFVGGFIKMLEQPQWNFYEQDLKLLSLSKSQIQERCTKAHEVWQYLNLQLEYMEETNSLKCDDKEFKTYQVKKLLENKKMPNDEKAQQIATLFVPPED